MSGEFRAVLFDWRGTLFHDEDDANWILASAASIDRTLSPEQANALSLMIGAAADNAELAGARASADCSPELHRQTVLLELRLAGIDDELALAICERDGDVAASMPYPDAPPVLRELRSRGVRIGIISDIHYDLRRHFIHFGLDDLVDSYTLSFEHGIQKPDPRLFEIALQAMSTVARHTLMVGDNPRRDCGAVALGMTTLILPPVPNFSERGLEVVLRLVA